MSISGGLEKAVERGLEVGCEAIQIFTKSSNQWRAKPLGEDEAASFRAAVEESGLDPVVAHDSYLVNLASPDEGLLAKSREAFLVEMRRAEQLGIPYLVTHPGAHKGAGVEEGLRIVAESFDALNSKTEGYALRVLLEVTAGQGTYLGFTFEHLRRVIDMVDEPGRFGVCFDTCHAFAAGYDMSHGDGYEAVWEEFDAVLGLERLALVHLNDSKKDLGSRVDRHEHIGKGALGLEPFRLLLNDPRFRRVPMILETPKGPDNAEDRENLAVLRGLIGKG